MRDYAYEDLEAENARERAENETFAAQEAEVLLAKENREFAQEDQPPGHMEAGFLIGFLQSAAKSKIRTNEVRYFALEVLAALNRDCK